MREAESSQSIQNRKQEHLDTCLNPGVRHDSNGLDCIRLPYDALFEVSDEQLDCTSRMGNVVLKFPLMFGAMTGGVPAATAFNTGLRKLASDYGLGMCLGSMRACLRDPDLISTYGAGHVDGLLANIGASEVVSGSYSSDVIARCCDRLGCTGLMIHLNGLQEFVQSEGNPSFFVSFDVLNEFIQRFPLPVWIKEVGSGLGGPCLRRISELPVAGIETACRGGTSWVLIEAMRRRKPISERHVNALDAIGYSLAESIPVARQVMKNRTVIGSGGIRDALDVIKCLSLGADLCAVAQPWYDIYHRGGLDALEAAVDEWISVGRLIWRSTGASNLDKLRLSSRNRPL